MKKFLSLILCFTMLLSIAGISTVSAYEYDRYLQTIIFSGENTICIDVENIDDGSLDSYWYKFIDGVVYRCYEVWNEGCLTSPAEVIAIESDEPDKKVKINGTVGFPGFDEYSRNLPVAVNLKISLKSNISEIEIDDGVISLKGIDSYNLKKITIGKDVRNIEDCFNNSSNLEVVIDEENPYLEMDENSIYSVNGDTKRLMTVVNPPEHYELKNDVTSYYKAINNRDTTSIKINSNLSYFCSGETYIKRIEFAENVDSLDVLDISHSRVKKLDLSHIKKKMIRFNAENAIKLKSIVLPEKLKKIESSGFSGTKKLQYIEIPDSILALDEETFAGSGISEIKLSANLKRIGYKAFKNCKNLKKVIFTGSNLRKIKDDAFKGTSSGIKFYTPDSKTAKKLKNKLAGTGVKDARIYAGEKLVYSNVK